MPQFRLIHGGLFLDDVQRRFVKPSPSTEAQKKPDYSSPNFGGNWMGSIDVFADEDDLRDRTPHLVYSKRA